MPYENKHTLEELRQWQNLPLDVKLLMTKERIRQWVNEFGEDNVCVSFSGGKDSTVLLHIVREMYPKVKAVFSNTGLEYPEIQRFVMNHENTEIIRPPIGFKDVVTQFGYPLIGKEVAEAIYYARKLRGGQTADRHKNELNGSRIKPSEQNLRGGRRITSSRQEQRQIEEQYSQARCLEGNTLETDRNQRTLQKLQSRGNEEERRRGYL